MEKEKLNELFEKWCKKLRIVPTWDVKLEFVDDPEWRKTGDFKIDCDDRKAILLLNTGNPKQENLEEVIVHELMHLKMYPLDQVTESLIMNTFEEGSAASNFAYQQFFCALEQTVEEMAKCFLLEFGENKNLSYGRCSGMKSFDELYEGLKNIDRKIRVKEGDMSITIRNYQVSDWNAIQKIHDESRKIELKLAGLEDAFLPLCIAAERENLFDYPGLFVAEEDGQVVGFVACSEEELAWLYIDPAHMRRGIGKRLTAYAMQMFPEIHSIEALVGNEPARALYESMGFEVTGIESGKMPGNEEFAVKVYLLERR